jgi:hypothetical protein
MQNMSANSKRLTLVVVGSLILATGLAQARQVRRIEGQHTTVLFSDDVTGVGVLDAALTLGPTVSSLDILNATSGEYNARLSTRCSDYSLFHDRHFGVTSAAEGDIARVCPGNAFPLRIEGAIDDVE